MRDQNRHPRVLSGLILGALLLAGGALRAQDPAPPANPSASGVRSCALATLDQRDQCFFLGQSAQILGQERVNECLNECLGCCDAFGASGGWSQEVYQALCNCLAETETTPGGLASCLDPSYLMELSGTVSLTELGLPADLAEAMRVINDIYYGTSGLPDPSQGVPGSWNWMDNLPLELQIQLRADLLVETLGWLQVGSSLLGSVTEVCGQLGTLGDEGFRNACRNDCKRVFPPGPANPDPDPDPGEGEDDEGGVGPGGPPGAGGPKVGPDIPLDNACIGTVGQVCTSWTDDGVAKWGKVSASCSCDSGDGTPGFNWNLGGPDPALCAWCTWHLSGGGGGGDILYSLIYQWY
ncbi:MAG TPA: hypothetical protein VF789_03545 [Thermoanaerobaculia bacterium]